MLEGVRRVLAEGRPHAGIELALHAEGGGRADRRRTRSTTRGSHARIGYVYDQAAPIGEIILGAPSSQSIEVTFHGRAAHSGMYPGGGPLGDRGRREGDRRSAPRAGRRGDDGERRA